MGCAFFITKGNDMDELMETGGQPEGLSFDDKGELQFTEAGLESFRGLVGNQDYSGDPRIPEQEEEEEEDKPEEEAAEQEETPPEAPQPAKRQLKVNGQVIEVDDEQVTALAQMGTDYQQKMADWREKDSALAPYEALIKQLQTDPGLSQHLATYFRQGPQQPAKPQFDDPIDQLKYDIRQELMQEFEARQAKLVQENIIPLHKQAALNQVKQSVMQDPDYQAVHGAILTYVQGLPPSLQKTTYAQLDQDPKAYIEMFTHYKQQLAANRTKAPTTTTTTEEEPAAKLEPAVRRTEKAPLLGSPNPAPPEVSAQKRAKVDKMKAAALRSGNVETLANWLDEGGFLDHLK